MCAESGEICPVQFPDGSFHDAWAVFFFSACAAAESPVDASSGNAAKMHHESDFIFLCTSSGMAVQPHGRRGNLL